MCFPAISSTVKWNGSSLSTHLVNLVCYVLFPLLFFLVPRGVLGDLFGVWNRSRIVNIWSVIVTNRSGADSVADSVARLGINLTNWCMPPINDLNCVSVLRLSKWMMTSVFLFVGVVPSELILHPSKFILVSQNSYLWRLMAKFSLSSLSRVLSISFSCCSSVPFDIIRISSRKAFVEFRRSCVVSIFFGTSREDLLGHRSHGRIYMFPQSLLKSQCFLCFWMKR